MSEPRLPRNERLQDDRGQVDQRFLRYWDQVKKRAFDWRTTLNNIANLDFIASADSANDSIPIYDADAGVAKRILLSAIAGSVVSFREYTAVGSDTWTKSANPAQDEDTALVFMICWGGGGGGCARSTNDAAGGGGGGCCFAIVPYSKLPSSLTIEVGGGGAGGASSGDFGVNGSVSYVEDTSTAKKWVQAYGGGRGVGSGTASDVTEGGGGGDALSGGTNTSGGRPGGGYSSAEAAALPTSITGGGQGGGGGGDDGANAVLGGAGGAGRGGAGGASYIGGNGGDGDGSDGQPRGGGGGAGASSGGDGGRGEIWIAVIG
jgi:hypothetical protein